MPNRNPGLWEPHRWTAEMLARRLGSRRTYKGIRRAQKGVMMAVFAMSGWTGIWWYVFTKSVVEKTPSSKLCKVDNVPNGILVRNGPSVQSTSRHKVSSRLLFWGRDGGTKPKGYRNAERCLFGASRTRISRFGGGLVLAALGAKLRCSRRGANVMVCRMPGFPGNTCRTDYILKILEHGVIARAPAEDFNVAALRFQRGAMDSKVMSMRRRCLMWTSKL
jgi:hypothetical protein